MQYDEKTEEKMFKLLLTSMGTFLIIVMVIGLLFVINACQYLPQMAQTIDDIADDTAIKTEISKEVLQKDTDVSVQIVIKNKQEK